MTKSDPVVPVNAADENAFIIVFQENDTGPSETLILTEPEILVIASVGLKMHNTSTVALGIGAGGYDSEEQADNVEEDRGVSIGYITMPQTGQTIQLQGVDYTMAQMAELIDAGIREILMRAVGMR